jgi:hypothetical protein
MATAGGLGAVELALAVEVRWPGWSAKPHEVRLRIGDEVLVTQLRDRLATYVSTEQNLEFPVTVLFLDPITFTNAHHMTEVVNTRKSSCKWLTNFELMSQECF